MLEEGGTASPPDAGWCRVVIDGVPLSMRLSPSLAAGVLVVVVGGHLVLSYLLLVSNLARLAARFCSRRSLASVKCAVISSS